MKETIKTTTVNHVYNKLHKNQKAWCPICGFNKGCNRRRKQKSYYKDYNSKNPHRFPNWKLVSKNEKQWMEKLLINKIVYYRSTPEKYYVDITWK